MALVLAVEPNSAVVVPSKDDPQLAVLRTDKPTDTTAEQKKTPAVAEPEKRSVDFVADIKPILERSCAACHHGDEPKGGLLVTERTSLLQGGESGNAAIVPGASGESPLLAIEPSSAVVVPSKDDPQLAVLRTDKPTDTTAAQKKTPAVAKPEKRSVDFVADIKPILERSCAACHHGDEPKGGLLVTERTSLLQGGESGNAAIVPGASGESPLLAFVSGEVQDMEMPPLEKREKFPPLSPDELARLRVWIDQGAIWPAGVKVEPPSY